MTREAINNTIWTLSLLLQLALIALVFKRHLARRIPSFTLMLVFYVLRSFLLFLFANHLASSTYARTYTLLAITDLFLQLAVAIELMLRVFPIPTGASPSVTLRRLALLLTIPALACGSTLLLIASLPANAPIPPDRLQMFDSLFFALLGVLAFGKLLSPWLLRVTLGLATYGVVNAASTIGRTFAAFHRDINHYLAWTYTASIAWLLIVVFWLITLVREPELS